MPSIPAALTWELFDRDRWSLLAAALGALAFPILLLSALAHDGALDPLDRSMLFMHLVMVQFNILMFGGLLMGNQMKMSQLYAYPASTAALVTWRLAPAMVAMFIETVVWTLALNVIFDLDWPIWGPALLSATAFAAAAAALWLFARSAWVVFALTIVSAVLGLWFKARYGGILGDPNHHWNAVTPAEIFTLLAFAAVAWRVAVMGVSRNRRGEPPFSIGFAAWLERVLDRAPSRRAAFRTPAHAQFWYDWRHGWLMPAFVIGVSLVGLIIWLFSRRDPCDLVEGVLTGVLMLVICAALAGGAAFGNLSARGDLVMGQFLATRPMTPTAQAQSILRAGAASLLLTWACWATALALACGLCAALGAWPSPLFPPNQNWRQLPAAMLGSWIVLGTVASAALTGRSRPIVSLIIAAFAGYIGFLLAAKFALSPAAFQQAMNALAAAGGVAFVVCTIWAFVAARRRGLIEAPIAWTALAAWAALVIGGVLAVSPSADIPRTGYVFLAGVLALAVAPLAAAPLAVAWSRHR